MNKEEIKKYILEHYEKYGTLRYLKKPNKLIETLNSLYPNKKFNEQAYLLIHDLESEPYCIDCNNVKQKFRNFIIGYTPRCKECGIKLGAAINKENRTKPIIKYKCNCGECGIEFFRTTKNEKELNKIRFCSNSCRAKYSYRNMSSETYTNAQESRKKTNLIKYGNEWVVNSEYTRNITEEKLGVKYPFQNIEVLKKSADTHFKRYGCKFGKNPAATQKMIETKLQKYGDLLVPSAKYYKEYKFPSGRIVKLQGYENLALDYLLKTYNEDDLVVGRKSIQNYTGIIKYSYNNKISTYYPDIYIISENKIIEVKCMYTYKIHKDVTEYKAQGCIKNGFKFELIIMSETGERIFI